MTAQGGTALAAGSLCVYRLYQTIGVDALCYLSFLIVVYSHIEYLYSPAEGERSGAAIQRGGRIGGFEEMKIAVYGDASIAGRGARCAADGIH